MIRPLTQLSAGVVLAMALLNAHAEPEAPEPLPLIDSQQAQAKPVTDIRLSEIPSGASKVVLTEHDNATLYVWPTPAGHFEFTPLKGDLGAVKQFDANLGYNWRFSRDGDRWQARRVHYQSQYEEEFDYPYERLTRGNPVLTDIGLFNESRMIDCLQTRGSKFSKDPNHTWTREEAVSTFSGGVHGMGADFMSKPGWEDIRACSPGMLTSLLYLDKERYATLHEVGLNQASTEELRLSEENLRQSEESLRQSEESLRQSEESLDEVGLNQASTEELRLSEENLRQSEESLRQSEENLRQSEESLEMAKKLRRQSEKDLEMAKKLSGED